ncbi:MAG: 4Fe-4S dicluster domain-containing protein [Verrucomicrobiales bacterium]|nr:4Fe-4S dicluster domain-containing protein [Verrucomicrobiales bacterium]
MLGLGLIKGLAETGRNFLGSYRDRERLVTVEYPEERLPAKENFRQFPFLVFDGDKAEVGLRCVACQICEKECPPQCIYIEKSKDKKPDHLGKPQFYPATFDIDISVCMSCQICVEVCPFDAIKMDQHFEIALADRFQGLLMSRDKLARSNTHFQTIHPRDAGEIDARRADERAKAEAKARADAEAKAKQAATSVNPATSTAAAAAPKSAKPPVAAKEGTEA